MFYYHPHTGRFEQRVKGRPMSARSSVRTSYSPIPTRSYDDDVLYMPFRPAYGYGRHGYDTTGEENYTRSQVNRELILSSAALEDNYDISQRSRNRDRDVLAAANRAITPQPVTGRESRGVSPKPRRSALRRSQSALSLRSTSVPPVQPTYTSTAYSKALVPVDTSGLRASAAPKPSQYLRYSKAIESAKSLREGTYSPMYSQSVRTSVSPFRERSLSLFRSDSPYRSPSPMSRGSPERTERSIQKRRAPRILANKKRVGNYYDRLLSRRGKDGRDCKNWPYLDLEEIENTDVGDLLSDDDYEDIGDSYVSQSNRYRDYEDEQDDSPPVRYVYESETDIPDDYVPFRPKVRYRSPDKDYSKMSLIPYLPRYDPTKTSAADAVTFNALVAESAARARQALERVNFDEYDSAGLVLSVEGEYHNPDIDTPLGFRYISRPMTLKVSSPERVTSAGALDIDNSFSKYWTDLQQFREGIRSRLEEGYKALTSTTRSYTPAISSYTPPPPSSTSTALTSYSSRPSRKSSYYKRLRDDKDYKYGQSLELYPLESSKGTLAQRKALPSSNDVPESRPMSVYDLRSDSDSSMSVLAKVKIKAALIGSKVDTVSPDKGYRRRPRSVYAQEKVRQLEKRNRDISSPPAVVAESTTELKASRPVPFLRPRRIWERELDYYFIAA